MPGVLVFIEQHGAEANPLACADLRMVARQWLLDLQGLLPVASGVIDSPKLLLAGRHTGYPQIRVGYCGG